MKPRVAGEKEPLEGVAVINPAEEVFVSQPDDEEERIVSAPEENDDSQSLDRSLVGYTVNGQPVQQDMSKTEQISQEESQSTNL